MAQNESCNYRQGPLPACAPLASSLTPMQPASVPAYDGPEALARGTLFPGLDLPFMDYVAAGPVREGPLAELMAVDFVAHELALYLDTHADDREAFESWQTFQRLAEEGRARYAAMCGPLERSQNADMDRWVWIRDPWPWENGRKGGNA